VPMNGRSSGCAGWSEMMSREDRSQCGREQRNPRLDEQFRRVLIADSWRGGRWMRGERDSICQNATILVGECNIREDLRADRTVICKPFEQERP
jgi:hypothetical protein